MNIQITQTKLPDGSAITQTKLPDGSTITAGTVDGKPYEMRTAPGFLPPFDDRVTGEDIMWGVQPTWKGKIKSGQDGGVYVAPKTK